MELKTATGPNGALVVSLYGEMDMYSSHLMKQFMVEHFSDSIDPIIVDCANLTYIDSSGVGVFLFTFAQSKKSGIRICFANIHGLVRRVIELTSLLGFLPIVDSIDDGVSLIATDAKT